MKNIKKDNKFIKGLSTLGLGVAFLAAASMGDETTASANNSQPAATLNLGQSLEVTQPIKGFNTAFDAINGTNVKKTYSAGKYFVYKQHGGATNISTQPGKPGVWVKTSDLSIKGSKPTTPNKHLGDLKAGDEIRLTADVSRFVSSLNASNNSGSVGNYSAGGKYYVYSVKGNGIYNISRTPGSPGSWVKLDGRNAELVKKGSVQPQQPQAQPKPGPQHGQYKKVMPTKNRVTVTSPYGVARWIPSLNLRDVHNGIDYVTGRANEPILSTEAGVVHRTGYDNGGGYFVIIKHPNSGVYTSYFHLKPGSTLVKAGQQVAAGQQIATMGASGAYVTGAHLHFMVSKTSNIFASHINPNTYLQGATYAR